MTWINDALPFLVNSLITEYDIRHGNVSIMRTFHLKPDEQIDAIDAMDKKQRVVTVGYLMKEDKEFSKRLEKGFETAVQWFIDDNGLDPDVDIVAIRRDAIFVINKHVDKTKFGDHIEFVEKNHYHAYLQLSNKLEFFFGDNGVIDIKGFMREDKDETSRVIKLLKPGMLSFLEEFVTIAESSNQSRDQMLKYLADFAAYYKARELDVEYYREFNQQAQIRALVGHGQDSTFDDASLLPDELIGNIDITFNYMNIFVPLCRIVI